MLIIPIQYSLPCKMSIFYHFWLIEAPHNWSENYLHIEFLPELPKSSGFKLQDHFCHTSWGGPQILWFYHFITSGSHVISIFLVLIHQVGICCWSCWRYSLVISRSVVWIQWVRWFLKLWGDIFKSSHLDTLRREETCLDIQGPGFQSGQLTSDPPSYIWRMQMWVGCRGNC